MTAAVFLAQASRAANRIRRHSPCVLRRDAARSGAPAKEPVSRLMLQSLYDWTLQLAADPHAVWFLAAISFIESSFFPLPPDLLLIPMILASPQDAWFLATVATVSSVAGGFLGYAIGRLAFDTLGVRILRFYGLLDKFTGMEALYQRWGMWIIIAKGMTPIPYKIVTIASGAFHFDLVKFGIASVICRSLRFFLLAALLWQFGEPIRAFIEGRLALLTTIFVVVLIAGFVAVRYLAPGKPRSPPA
jgi:membrane protein YqaA with SNARE-associated domain